MATFISDSPADTHALGRRLAAEITAGSILALEGELGVGKTQFTKGLVEGLGSDAVVTSPTFTIIHEYPGGRLPVYHLDFFRLDDRARVTQLDLNDYFFGNGVCVIEWPDRFTELIPAQARWIRFELKSADRRVIHTE